jgi:predicted nucleotidyltransferase
VHITDLAAPPIRVTRDVDAIVQVLSLSEYHHLSEKLRAKGFREDTSDDAPICRWVSDEVILDVMPTETRILGFGNRWYDPAIEHAVRIALPSGKSVRMVSAPYFLITKLEAFDGRGNSDYLRSHDIEDIIAVLDGRPTVVDEVKQAESNLASELSARFQVLLQDQRFVDAVSGHMPSDATSQARVAIILDIIKSIAENR